MKISLSDCFLSYDVEEHAIAVLRFCHSKGFEGNFKKFTDLPTWSPDRPGVVFPDTVYGIAFDWPIGWTNREVDSFLAEIHQKLGIIQE